MTLDYIPFEAYSTLHNQSKRFDTGFVFNAGAGRTWGRGAAGILVVSSNLQEMLLLKRSSYVEDPHLWGIPGGARKEVENGLEEALITAVEESREEMGLLPRGKIRKNPYIYQKPHTDFTYQTFILEIDPDERTLFVPHLNWENTEYRWIQRNLMKDIALHPRVQEVLDNYQF